MYAHMADNQTKLQAIKLPAHLLIFSVKESNDTEYMQQSIHTHTKE